MENNKPAFEKRLGHIRVAIWRNTTEGKAWHNVSITRQYKDKNDDQWHDASTFNGLADLALVAECVGLARGWIMTQETQA